MGVIRLSQRQLLGVGGVIGVLAIAILLPLWVQDAHGISAVKVSFGVIVVFFLANYYMKKKSGL